MSEIFFLVIGWLYLFLRYRNKEKRKAVLMGEYADSYTTAGSDLVFNLVARPFAFICFLLMVVLIGVTIYSVIVHGIS